MGANWKQLLSAGDATPDVYAAVGRHRFDTDRESLRAAVHEAVVALQAWHNHSDAVLRLRAIRWHREFCGLEAVFRDPERFRTHQQALLAELTKRYAEGAGVDPRRWNVAALEQWLQLVQNVHPSRLAETARSMIAAQTTAMAAESTGRAATSGIGSGGGGETQRSTTPASLVTPTAPLSGGNYAEASDLIWGDIAARMRPNSTGQVVRPGTAPVTLPPSAADTPQPPNPESRRVEPIHEPPRDPHPAATSTSTASWDGSGSGGYGPSRLPPFAGAGLQPSEYAYPLWPSPPSPGMSTAAKAAWIIGALLLAVIVPMVVGLWLLLNRQAERSNETVSKQVASPIARPAASSQPLAEPKPSSSIARASPSNSPPRLLPSLPPSPATPPPPPTATKNSTSGPPEPTPSSPSTTPSGDSPQPAAAPSTPSKVGSEPLVLQHRNAVAALAWNSKGDRLATGDAQGNLVIWNAASGGMEKDFPGLHSGRITAVAYSADDRWLATTSEDAKIIVVGLSDYSVHSMTFTGARPPETTAATWRAGNPPQLLVGDAGGGLTTCKVSDGAKWQSQTRTSLLTGGIRHLGGSRTTSSFRPAATYVSGGIVLGNPDAPAPDVVFLVQDHSLWEEVAKRPATSNSTIFVPLTVERTHATSFNDRDSLLAVACGDVEVWELSAKVGALRAKLIPGSSGLDGYRCVGWSSSGRFLAAGDGKGRMNVWEMPSGKQFSQYTFSQAVTEVAWSPAGVERLAAACDDGEVRVWPAPTTPEPGPFTDVAAIVSRAAEFIEEDDAEGMYRAVCLLQAQSLSSIERTQLEDLRAKLQQEASRRIADLRSRYATTQGAGRVRPPRSGDGDTLGSVLELYRVIDWDPTGRNGAEARRMLETLVPKASFAATTAR